MIDCDVTLATSDGLNRTALIFDVGHESGIGSDSESSNGTDTTITPTTDDPATGHASTPGDVTPEWRRLAERYESDLPPEAMSVELDGEIAQMVLQPPPPPQPIPEVDSTMRFRPSARRLPALPTNETRLDQLPASPTSGLHYTAVSQTRIRNGEDEIQHQERGWRDEDEGGVRSAKLWRKAASVSADRDRHWGQIAAPARTTTGDIHHETARSSTVLTLPPSRAERQPISDVAPAVVCLRPSCGDQQRIEVVKPAPLTGSCDDCSDTRGVMTSQRDVACDVTDRHGRPVVTSFGPVPGKGTVVYIGDYAHIRPRNTGSLSYQLSSMNIHIESRSQDVDEELDRKPVENGIDDQKWSHVNAARYNAGRKSRQPDDVNEPDATSDRKQFRHVTSPERDRKQHVTAELPEVEAPGAEVGHSHRAHGIESDEGRVDTSTRLYERRRGEATTEQPLTVMVDQGKLKERQLRDQDNSLVPAVRRQVAPSGELNHNETTSRHRHESIESSRSTDLWPPLPVDVVSRHRGSESPRSPVSSPSSTPVRLDLGHPGHGPGHVAGHEGESPIIRSCPRLDTDDGWPSEAVTWGQCPVTWRQREYEAGLRRFGPNHDPQHSYNDLDHDDVRPSPPSTGTHPH